MKYAWWAGMVAALGAGCITIPPPPPDVQSQACTSNVQCSGGTPVCDTALMACVACTSSDIGVCTGMTPVCGGNDACRACSAHSECPLEACLPDGSCGDDTEVAFVDPSGGGTTCTHANPCATMTAAIETARPYIKVRGTIDDAPVLNSRDLTILAQPGAVLKNSSGDGLTLRGAGRVEIYDLTVSQAMTGIHLTDTSTASLFLSGVKLDNNGNGGLWAEGGTVTITRSTISNNVNAGGVFATGATLVITTSTFASNAGGAGVGVTANGSVTVSRSNFINNVNGGITVIPTGTFSIVGNVFFNNGQVSTGVCGGVCIDTGTNAANRLELNTFVGNRTSTQHAAGIQCSAGTFTARNNIISGNTGGTNQYSGTCSHAYSIVRPGAVPAGTGNVASDPMFAGAATGNLHLTINSPARGAGDPATDITGIAGADIDGDARQVPPDIGADQY